MSKKNKNQYQQKQQTQLVTEQLPQQVPIVEEVPPKIEEYTPSVNSEKYPPKEEPDGTFKYKILTYRNDYIRLQEEITNHLNDGWELVGGVSTAFHADNYSTLNMFSQAIVKRF